MLREDIKVLVQKAIKDKYNVDVEVKIEKIANPVFGDYSTNVAMLLKKDPKDIVSAISFNSILDKIEVKNGFINFFVSSKYLQKQVREILKRKSKYTNLDLGKGKKVNVEFISANPTGPLTLGNGRGGFSGDVLSNVFKKAGYSVVKEYYINDTGEQVKQLGHSVLGDDQAVYQGDYIKELRNKIKGEDVVKIGEKAAKIILDSMVKPTVKRMGIKFDVWFSEKSLFLNKEIAKTLLFLEENNLIYKKDGALWFKSTQFADDKDRVLIKQDGEPTYFLSDIAYLKNKFKRKFDKLFIFLGADHFGYVGRIKAAAQALRYKDKEIEIVIMQLVRLLQQGQEVRMSKREGIYVTLDELIEEVGLDVARFFFLSKAANSHLNFDLDLAKEQSNKNPVYYIQYAYARIISILRKLKVRKSLKIKDLNLLNHPSELNLIKSLVTLPEVIYDTSLDYQVQRLPQYALNLATAFHLFYRDCRILESDKKLKKARMSLLLATKVILENTLNLMGISLVEKM